MQTDDRAAWLRLLASVILATVGGIGLWAQVIILPSIQTEFGLDRAGASLPYAATLIGFAIGGVLMGRLTDRYGVFRPLIGCTVILSAGFILAGMATSYFWFIVIQMLLIGLLGSSIVFGPLVADISHWFIRHRGFAVSIVASGNYLAGATWPPFLQMMVDTYDWRTAYMATGVVCLVIMLPLSLALRRQPDLTAGVATSGVHAYKKIAMPRTVLLALLALAGVACCVAMSMPQVHIVAYCVDLGYGTQRGAQLLSLMLGLGVVSRVVSGLLADRIGGVATLLFGSSLQCLALLFYLPYDGFMSLVIITAMFGLAQGGIVPSYAIIVRQYFPPDEAGAKVSFVLMSTVVGMALGGWMSGELYDWTGSYQAAFIIGIAWNVLNLAIAIWLLKGRMFKPIMPSVVGSTVGSGAS